MSWIDDLTFYLDQSDPAFRVQLTGASDSEIRQLENVLGTPLVEVYREFLMAMGQNDGGLFRGNGAQTDVQTMIQTAKSIQEECPAADFRKFTPIAVGDSYEGWALWHEKSGPPVVLIDHNQPFGYVAETLPKLAFRVAFPRRARTMAHQTSFKVLGREVRFHRFIEFATAVGFIPEWFSDVTEFFGNRSGILLHLRHQPGWGVMGWVSAEASGNAESVAKAFVNEFDRNTRRDH